MLHPLRVCAATILATVLSAGAGTAWGQAARVAPARPAARPAAAAPAAAAPAAPARPADGTRVLAPGVMQPVDNGQKYQETVERHDLTEVLYVNNNLEKPYFEFAKDVPIRHDVSVLDFQYKPMRMIWADVPGAQGHFERKLVWYLVYCVTNHGKTLHPVEDEDKTYKVETVDKPMRFVPEFTLEVHNRLQNEVPGSAKVYREKFMPIVLPAIRAREDAKRTFLDSVQIEQKPIEFNQTVWGIATWTDIDPRNVWFSVYIEGLTIATQYKDEPEKYVAAARGAKSAPFRSLYGKALKLNFWRPGDEYTQKENQIRIGVPALSRDPNEKAMPAYEWIWRRTVPASQ